MSNDEILSLIPKLNWTFAKTYANKSPHEYVILRPDTKHRDEIAKFIDFIKNNGEDELYYGHPFKVFKIDGRKYWYAYQTDNYTTPDILNRSTLENVDTVYE